MTEYRKATAAEYEKCLNFGNYVFSQAHRPHDFRALLPKTYKNEQTFAPVPHFIAMRDDGEIRGLVALRDTQLKYLENTLSCGFVGTVSVHPYARSEGHMKGCMGQMLAYAAEKNYDMLILGGQRQRYGYFGFDCGGTQLVFNVSSTNLRHKCSGLDASSITFRDIAEEIDTDYAFDLYEKQPAHGIRERSAFLDILHSWNSPARLILENGTPIGYVAGAINELLLEDETKLPTVLKAFYAAFGISSAQISCGLHQQKRIEMLEDICENCYVSPCEMINVLNWKNVLTAMLEYKANFMPLEDGERILSIDGQNIKISVRLGEPGVSETDETGVTLEHLQAMRLFFGTASIFHANLLPQSWCALPFFISPCDSF